MKKVLVTGANGMLGKDLCPIFEANGYKVIRTDVANMDITNSIEVELKITQENPEFIIHCAAYTDVDSAEKDIKTARLINKIGTENIAKASSKTNSTLVYISTDYVFDGNTTRPYSSSDNTNPINNYGLTKLEGEHAIEKYCKNYYIVRTSWLYGIHGKNFVETMINLANNPEIKVIDDQVGCPTWTVDLANGIINLIKTKHYGKYHICGGGYTSWYGFAKEIFKYENLKVNLAPCTTQEYPRAANRPRYSVMDNNGTCRNWESALKDYIKLRKGVIKK